MELIMGLVASAGGWVTAALAAIVAFVSAIFYHRHKVNRAEDKGRDDGAAIERDRLRRDTERATTDMEQQANEISNEVRRDTADPDDLLERLRRESTDYGDKS